MSAKDILRYQLEAVRMILEDVAGTMTEAEWTAWLQGTPELRTRPELATIPGGRRAPFPADPFPL